MKFFRKLCKIFLKIEWNSYKNWKRTTEVITGKYSANFMKICKNFGGQENFEIGTLS